jgi:hypothetical protein
MVDLYTHVLVGYTLGTLLSWRYERITHPFVTVLMAGAVLPDLSRIDLLVSSGTVENVLGVSFAWLPLHRVGGTLLVVCIGSLLAAKRHRRAVFVLLAIGAGSHYLLDFLLYKPSGKTGALLWPFTTYRFPIDGFYSSTDRWPAIVATATAAAAWYIDRRKKALDDLRDVRSAYSRD